MTSTNVCTLLHPPVWRSSSVTLSLAQASFPFSDRRHRQLGSQLLGERLQLSWR